MHQKPQNYLVTMSETIHKVARLQWAKGHLSFGDKWLNAIFSKEKRGTSMILMILNNIGMISTTNLKLYLTVNV